MHAHTAVSVQYESNKSAHCCAFVRVEVLSVFDSKDAWATSPEGLVDAVERATAN